MSFDVSLILKDLQLPESHVDILAKSESHLLKVRIKGLQFQDTPSIMNAGLGHFAQSHVQAGYDTRYAQKMVNYLPEDVKRVICA